MKLWQKIKSIGWEWLPFSGMVIATYMIQRGFMAISKAGFTEVDITGAMSIFFTATALSAVVIGFLSDRIRAPLLVAFAGCAGTAGIVFLDVSTWVFGIGMGIAAATVKMIPFSMPLKHKKTKIDALRISPQAASKQIGASMFLLFFAATLKTIGFDWFTTMVAPVFALMSVFAVYATDKYNYALTRWNAASIWRILKNYKWWGYTAWYSAMAVGIYTTYPKVIPYLMKGEGLDKATAIYIFAILGLTSVPFRWVWGWLGDNYKIHFQIMLAALAFYIIAIPLFGYIPLVVIPLFFVAMKMGTQNFWVVARNWFGERDVGTAMGMVFIINYLILGFYLGKW